MKIHALALTLLLSSTSALTSDYFDPENIPKDFKIQSLLLIENI